MISQVAKQAERLDQIFFQHYLDPQFFVSFLLANGHLLKTPILSGGELVNLPKELTRLEQGRIKSPLLDDWA